MTQYSSALRMRKHTHRRQGARSGNTSSFVILRHTGRYLSDDAD